MFYALLNADGTLDRYPYTITDLIRANPGTSWPEVVSEQVALNYGLVPVTPVEPDPENPLCNRRRTAELQSDGTWLEAWVDTPATAAEIAERTAQQAAVVRDERNHRLSECDWTQLPDAPADATAWATYRQALRDITSQPGFPWDVEWPLLPGTELTRARNADGTFMADDPATPDTNEAWVGGVAP